jgi:hypothetical protein
MTTYPLVPFLFKFLHGTGIKPGQLDFVTESGENLLLKWLKGCKSIQNFSMPNPRCTRTVHSVCKWNLLDYPSYLLYGRWLIGPHCFRGKEVQECSKAKFLKIASPAPSLWICLRSSLKTPPLSTIRNWKRLLRKGPKGVGARSGAVLK